MPRKCAAAWPVREGIFAGISAAGACWVAQQIALREQDATIVFVVCDRGDRYLSLYRGCFLPEAGSGHLDMAWCAGV